MPIVERRIRQVHRARSAALEDQFWPIAVAILATAGLAAGAVTAVWRGPWLWGALLTMPFLCVMALVAVYRLRNRWFRRSVQLSVLASLAVHLLAIMVSAALEIFGGHRPRPVVERPAPQPAPTMIVSQREPQPIWEQVNLRHTPDPTTEFQREPTQTQPIEQSQPIEVPEAQPTADAPAIQRRPAPPTVARQDVSLSQLRRSEHRPAAQPSAARVSPSAARPQPSESLPEPRAAESTARAVPQPDSARADSPTPHETQATSPPRVMAETQRRERAQEQALPSEMAATANMRNANLTLPQAASANSTVTLPTPSANAPSATVQSTETPSARAVEGDRSSARHQSAIHVASTPTPDQAASRQPARPERATIAATPSDSPATAQRLINSPSPTASNADVAQRVPTQTLGQQSPASPQEAATLATRGERGGAHATSFENMQSIATPSAGMAAAPSDSSAARRAENRVDPQPSLTTVERPLHSGRQTGNQVPQSAWQANVEQPSTLTGNTEPALQSMESAAANVESASRRTGLDRPSEQGAGLVDLGPVKLVADQQAQRQSGGGQPAPSQLLDEGRTAPGGDGRVATRAPTGGQPTDGRAASVAQNETSTEPATQGAVPAQPESREGPADSGRAVSAQSAASRDDPSESAMGAPRFEAAANDAGTQRPMTARRQDGLDRPDEVAGDPLGGLQPNRVSRGPQVDVQSRPPEGAMESDAAPSGGSQPSAVVAEAGDGRERASTAMALEVSAPPGAPGLAQDPRPGLGSTVRPATRDATDSPVHQEARFRRSQAGGAPAVAADANVAAESFRSRRENRSASGPSTEAAIELGLEFLARHQRPDGRWVLEDFDQHDARHGQLMPSDMAATGLALLAFQGAGYTHRDFKYAEQLSRAVQWLVDHQQPNGLLFVTDHPQRSQYCQMYSHAIATLALTEAYGMTQDPALRDPIERALDYMAATQDEQYGGWRYVEPERAVGERSDTSVTGWMMMALQSARLAEFHIAPSVWEGIDRWLTVSRDADQDWLFRYNPFAEDGPNVQRSHGRQSSPSMTSVGLLMRLYTGWDRRDARLIAGGNHLLQHLPSDRSPHERDTYYWYYATQVLRHIGGEAWDQWNRHLHPLLVTSQVKPGEMAGSWDPFAPLPDRWGHAGGRLYVTTMNLLSLEVNYRLLPLYENTAQ